MEIYLYILFAWNVIVMLLYGWDKFCAVRGRRRIREAVLIAVAFIMGGMGAVFGMVLFNHKTSKMKFRMLVPLSVTVNAAIIVTFVRQFILK